MSNSPPEYGGEGWWKANDGKWYPPNRHPDYTPPAAEPAPTPLTQPSSGSDQAVDERHEPATRLRAEATGFDDFEVQDPFPRGSQLRVLRLVVFVLLAVAAIGVVTMEPDADTADIAVARFSADTNEDTATGAPQQQVVNGWEAADLLDVIATRSTDNRVPLLLLIVVFTLCWQFSTAAWSTRTVPT